MKKIFCRTLVFTVLHLLALEAYAFTSNHWWIGAGYYSENALNKVATKSDGSKSLSGAMNLPLVIRYDRAIRANSWFVAPQLSYSLIPRDTEGKTAKVTIMHLAFPLGKNEGAFEWSVGPGLLRETIKGQGGTVEMSNGTSTATFAQPGREVTLQKVTLDFGAGYITGRFKFGFDLYLIAPLSSSERSQNLMFSITYDLSGATGGGQRMFAWSK